MPRVLVLDDSPMLVELTVEALLAAGFQAAGAVDLASLDAQLKGGPVDLVLMDVNMPEMFGDDVVEYLRHQRGVKAKLVLYSDIAEPELVQKTRSSGADGYIGKADGIEGVVARVRQMLGVAPRAPLPAPRAAEEAESPTPEAGSAKRPRILIVDDSEMTARIIEADLVSKGFEVHVADSAEAATKIILKKQTRPDLVLLDVRMPNVNGEQFCRFIKGNTLFAGIKVLLCSGENVEELQRICREAGADGYVAKDAVLSKVVARELA
ncbi:MAG: response regulator [Myxococcaceae bacterium]|nr:response regulator [Myxococcaceae bacterium]MCI0671328.1 response regulator [Myxococcaceae bacterium]